MSSGESDLTATGLRAIGGGRRREEPTMTEVGTKLDLARAYVDMGDPDGARSILNEVLEEGDPAQRQEARQLLEARPLTACRLAAGSGSTGQRGRTCPASRSGSSTTARRSAAGSESRMPRPSRPRSSGLFAVADEPVAVTAAGRTDAGVHASGQVVHFDSAAPRSLRSWLLGVNSNLPRESASSGCARCRRTFTPATAHGAHLSLRHPEPAGPFGAAPGSGLVARRRSGSAPRCRQAAQTLLGEHDFSAFRAAQCQARHPVRQLQRLEVRRDGHDGEYLVVECRANAFLHHMVRNIVGSLVRVGRGEESVDWLARVLRSAIVALRA